MRGRRRDRERKESEEGEKRREMASTRERSVRSRTD